MIYLYLLHMERDLHEEEMSHLLGFVASEKKEKVKKYRFMKDAQRTLLGDVLVRYLICKRMAGKNEKLRFKKNNFGKPLLVSSPFAHFNISHSGEWVVAALSSYPVGIDVEEIKSAPLEISKHFFSKDEDLTLSELGNRQVKWYSFR